jgi:thiol-disulfide isomerase/thioredoxin
MPLAAALLLSAGLLDAPVEAPAKLPVLHTAAEILALGHGSDRPVIVHFWATWCEACVRELSEMRELERSARDLDVPLWWVSLDAPKDSLKVAAFMRQHHLLAEVAGRGALLDAADPGPITTRFNPRWQAELPATFVVLQSGAVAASHRGPTPVDVVLKEVRELIRTQQAGRAAPVRRTEP